MDLCLVLQLLYLHERNLTPWELAVKRLTEQDDDLFAQVILKYVLVSIEDNP
jgi:hypothetical protein